MRKKFSKLTAGIFSGIFLVNVASAHPGHSPTDVTAEISQPLAGLDHFAVFVAMTSLLLLAFWLCLRKRATHNTTVR